MLNHSLLLSSPILIHEPRHDKYDVYQGHRDEGQILETIFQRVTDVRIANLNSQGLDYEQQKGNKKRYENRNVNEY